MATFLRALAALLVALCLPSSVAADESRHVLLVINDSSADSKAVGEYYQQRRGIPETQTVRLTVEPGDQVSRLDYEHRIEGPIAAWLGREAAHDRTLFIVLTKGVPLRISGTAGRSGSAASVDSELALLYRRLTRRAVAPQGLVANPYFLGNAPISEARPFTHVLGDIFLVTRLDGFTVDDAKGLVDRGSAPVPADWRILLDQKAAGSEDPGNRWLAAAATRLGAMGHASRVQLDASSQPLTGGAALGYYSWGSNDAAQTPRRVGVTFVPGALAGWFVGGDARTFTAPPASWSGGTRGRPDTFYAGGPDALAGDLVRAGATGVGASVADPFLDGAVRPDILFPAYLAGYSLAEAFYLAIPNLSWQTVVIGDPLCRPFAGPRADAAALDPPLDPVSLFPHEFTTRWLDAMGGPAAEPGTSPREALRLVLRSERRVRQGDYAGAVEALNAAIERAPTLPVARLQLAQVHDANGEWARAAEAYRAVLALRPNDVVALNNLAYLLAERLDAARDALAYVERAYFASHGEPAVTDTLAWVHHRLGNHAEARRFIREALTRLPDAAELRYHAAEIEAGAGDLAAARVELDRALALAPILRSRDNVQALMARLPAVK